MKPCKICGQTNPVAPMTKAQLAQMPTNKLQSFARAQEKIAEREGPYARHYSKTFNRARIRTRRAEEILTRKKPDKPE